MSRPLNLYRLQQIDSQIDQARARRDEIAATLADNLNLRKAKALAARTQKALTMAQTAQRQAETKVRDQRLKIEQNESTLYSGRVQNPKELQDLQNEVAALKRFLGTLEDRQLEAMLASDDANDKAAEAEVILQKYLARTKKQAAELNTEDAQIEKKIQELMIQRGAAEDAVSLDDRSIYNRLRKQRAGVAVAMVRDQTCTACGSLLTASLHQAARSPSQITYCEACGRILYAS